MVEREKKHVFLKKHVATIHCSNAISLLQRKISNALLFHAYHELIKKDEHQITIQNLCNIIGYVGNNSAAIKEAIKGLIGTVMEWNILNERTGEEEWNASSILASVKISGSICTYSYSKLLKGFIYTPSVYGKINMIVQAKFKSAYGLALYENCIRYSGLPYTGWFNLYIFRKLMGVPETQYLIFRDFKKRVLDKAVLEVNTHSELIVKPEVIKVGKKVEKIRFALQKDQRELNTNYLLTKSNLSTSNIHQNVESEFNNDLVKELVENWRLNIKQAQKWLNLYGTVKLREKIDYIKSTNAFKARTIHKMGAYLHTVLENGFQPQCNKTISQEKLVEERNRQESIRKIKPDYEKYLEQQVISAFKNLPLVHQEVIEKEFIRKLQSEAGGEILVNCFKVRGIESVQNIFADFIIRYYPNVLQNLPTIEDFMRNTER